MRNLLQKINVFSAVKVKFDSALFLEYNLFIKHGARFNGDKGWWSNFRNSFALKKGNKLLNHENDRKLKGQRLRRICC